MDNGFLPVLIEKLRVGNHEDAGQETKILWEIIGTELIPSVVSTYKRDMQLNAVFSDVVTKAQEAMVWWLLKVCYLDWVEEWKADQQAVDENQLIKRRTKPRGRKNYSNRHAVAYMSLLNRVDRARTDETTGKGWDLAIKRAAVKRYKEHQVITEGSIHDGGVSRKKQRLVFEIKDGHLW